MKILYINSPQNDFLSDSFLIGLKNNYGKDVIEWPLNKHIYKKQVSNFDEKLHGIGFTLYQLLEESLAVPFDETIELNNVDLFIFGDIYRQIPQYLQLKRFLTKTNTLLLDGEDTPAIYPYYFAPWKKPYSFFFPKIHKKHLYFKREIIERRTNYYSYFKLIPKFLTPHLKIHSNVKTISFSIPVSKVIQQLPTKSKLFPRHIVDEEVRGNVAGSVSSYAFDSEKAYYEDLQQSKYGITTKRGGWDCLRHYEIAANGAVICFKNLHLKAKNCAPHDLIDGINCINYSNFSDLKRKIERISEENYLKMQQNSLNWVKTKTCEALVMETLTKLKTKK